MALLPNTTTQDASHFAERWRTSFKTMMGQNPEPECRTTLSLGIATYPTHGSIFDDILRASDKALYQAKSTGRDRTAIFDPRL